MTGKTVLITGSSGYLGRALCRRLAETDWCERIVGVDLALPPELCDRLSFHHREVNDPGLAAWMQDVRPDVLVHLAFIVTPMHDAHAQWEINVEGTRNVLRAASAAQVPQVMVASSGTAYGAWPDNPVPLRETDPIRPSGFSYADEKAELEDECERFGQDHSDVVLSVIRPCVVYGPNVRNYLSDLLTALPIPVALSGEQPPLQFVHESDVAAAMVKILETRAKGAFNIAPPDTMTLDEVFELVGRKGLLLPERVLSPLFGLLWKLRVPFPHAPPSFLDFMRYPWVLDSQKLRDLGFTFQYSSRDTLSSMLRSKGRGG
jgi:UDP-glucose 4-epimerase